jgi:lipid-A-disaccharide synthase-like uncharacterized protein
VETGTFLAGWLRSHLPWLYAESAGWTAFGLAGNLIFSSRFVIQWWASEKKKRVVVPGAFWQLSFWGSLISLLYAFHVDKLPVILSTLFLPFLYGRNLVLLKRQKTAALGGRYEGRVFAGVENTANGDVDSGTRFKYRQDGDVLWAEYQGPTIRKGTLTGRELTDGTLDFTYQHVSNTGEIRTGRCSSRPEVLADGRIRLHETWRWTNGDQSAGHSIVEEVR